MEVQFNAAKQREWEAWKATSVPRHDSGGRHRLEAVPAEMSGGNSGGSSGGGSGGWQVPCSYTSITSPFGNRKSPTAGASSYHQGVDLDTGTGDPVYATRAGVVTVAGWGNAAGNYVQINHQDGFSSIYMHLSGLLCVRRTDRQRGTADRRHRRHRHYHRRPSALRHFLQRRLRQPLQLRAAVLICSGNSEQTVFD